MIALVLTKPQEKLYNAYLKHTQLISIFEGLDIDNMSDNDIKDHILIDITEAINIDREDYVAVDYEDIILIKELFFMRLKYKIGQ